MKKTIIITVLIILLSSCSKILFVSTEIDGLCQLPVPAEWTYQIKEGNPLFEASPLNDDTREIIFQMFFITDFELDSDLESIKQSANYTFDNYFSIQDTVVDKKLQIEELDFLKKEGLAEKFVDVGVFDLVTRYYTIKKYSYIFKRADNSYVALNFFIDDKSSNDIHKIRKKIIEDIHFFDTE